MFSVFLQSRQQRLSVPFVVLRQLILGSQEVIEEHTVIRQTAVSTIRQCLEASRFIFIWIIGLYVILYVYVG